MARRKDHTRDQLKTMAIESGYKIIEKQGIKNLTMRKISGDIGYTVGTLYNIFEDFSDLMLHINAKTLDALYALIDEKCVTSKNSKDTLKKIAHIYIEFATKNFHLWSVLTDYEHDRDDRPQWYQDKTGKLFTLVETSLHTTTPNKKRAAQSAKILWASVHGICVLGLNGRLDLLQTDDVATLTDNLIDTYMAGLTA